MQIIPIELYLPYNGVNSGFLGLYYCLLVISTLHLRHVNPKPYQSTSIWLVSLTFNFYDIKLFYLG